MPIYLRKSKGCTDDLLIYSPSLPPKPIQIKGKHHEYHEFSNVMTIEEFNQYAKVKIIDEVEENTFLLEDGTIKTSHKYLEKPILSICLGIPESRIKSYRQHGIKWKDIIKKPNEIKLDKKPQLRRKTYNGGLATKDHLGNIYNSQSAMCKHYNIPIQVYKRRMKGNWGLERTLTTPVHGFLSVETMPKIDHKGHLYDSFSHMCRTYGLSIPTVRARLEYGQTLEQALTTPIKNYQIHYNGKTYPSISELLHTYSIKQNTYSQRKKSKPNQTVEEIIDSILKDRNT